MYRDGSSRQACDQAVALTRRDTEYRGSHTVHNNGKQCGAQSDQRFIRLAAEIHHVADGGRHRAVDLRHHEHAEKIKHRTHHDRCPDFQAPGRDACGDRIRRVGPAVYKYNSQCEQHRDHKDRV